MAKRPDYPQEFRERAVRMTMDGSRTVGQVALELGIAESSLVNWRKKLGASIGRTAGAVRDVRDENESLRAQLKLAEKEKRALAMENEILKKAAAFFARNQA